MFVVVMLCVQWMLAFISICICLSRYWECDLLMVLSKLQSTIDIDKYLFWLANFA